MEEVVRHGGSISGSVGTKARQCHRQTLTARELSRVTSPLSRSSGRLGARSAGCSRRCRGGGRRNRSASPPGCRLRRRTRRGAGPARSWLGPPGLVDGGPADLVAYDTDPTLMLLRWPTPPRHPARPSHRLTLSNPLSASTEGPRRAGLKSQSTTLDNNSRSRADVSVDPREQACGPCDGPLGAGPMDPLAHCPGSLVSGRHGGGIRNCGKRLLQRSRRAVRRNTRAPRRPLTLLGLSGSRTGQSTRTTKPRRELIHILRITSTTGEHLPNASRHPLSGAGHTRTFVHPIVARFLTIPVR
ncbi:MAG: hypothetical protein JWO67_7215 [Streptosporangiaceae bacterium]|nr:hypothetical protein [Streptosporangiaceae bacterium]